MMTSYLVKLGRHHDRVGLKDLLPPRHPEVEATPVLLWVPVGPAVCCAALATESGQFATSGKSSSGSTELARMEPPSQRKKRKKKPTRERSDYLR